MKFKGNLNHHWRGDLMVVSIICLMLAAACTPTQPPPRYADITPSRGTFTPKKIKTTQDLLSANTGGFTMAVPAQNALNVDPLKAHLNARKQVKPTDRSAKRNYTATANVPNDAASMRVLRLQNTADSQYAGLNIRSKKLPFKTQDFGAPATAPDHLAQTRYIEQKIIYTPPSPKPTVAAPVSMPIPTLNTIPKGDVIVKPSSKPTRAMVTPSPKVITPPVISKPTPSNIIMPPVKPSMVSRRAEVGNNASVTETPKRGVMNIRKGDHMGYTRIVLDLDRPYTFEHVLNDDQKTLMIKMPDAYWGTALSQTYTPSARLTSHTAHNLDRGGAVLTLNFMNPITVESLTHFPAAAGKPPRLVIDVSDNL